MGDEELWEDLNEFLRTRGASANRVARLLKQKEQQLEEKDLAVYAAGFEAPYRGKFAESLLKALDDRISKVRSDVYSYFVPIIQASGFGKTRSLLELSNLGVFVFYINCQDKARGGYPLRSAEADSLRVRSDKQGLGLLCAVLRELREFLGQYYKEQTELAEKQEELEEEFEGELDEELEKVREKLAALDALSDERKKLVTARKSLKSSIQKKAALMGEVEMLRKKLGLHPSSAWTADQVLLARDQVSQQGRRWLRMWQEQPEAEVEDVRKAFKDLVRKLRPGALNLKVLFVLDECSGLFRDSAGFTSGYFIRKSFEHVPGLMGVLVDTRANLPVMAPAAPQDPSFRIVQEIKVPLEPYCEMETILRPDWTDLKELYTFGRPLWQGLIQGQVNDLLAIAVRKLLGGISYSQVAEVEGGKVTLEAAMAVLSACLSLAVVPQSHLALTLAGAYMSPVVEISKDRTSMAIMDAWDPVLSAAGKSIFRKAAFRKTALIHLVRASEDYLIDEGKNGELVCRYILLRAMIRAEEGGTVTVKAFVKELVGQGDSDELDELGDLKDYVLNFDSFVPITFSPQPRHLKKAYYCRKALICKPGQTRFDAVVPVVGPGNVVSMIGFQFKSLQDKRVLSDLGGEFMDPLPAGFGEFKSFVTVLLQIHPRSKPTCKYQRIVRNQGEIVTSQKVDYEYQITSTQAAYVLDGLEAISFLKDEEEADEVDMLKQTLTCRRLRRLAKLPYFRHLECILKGMENGEEQEKGKAASS